MLWDASRVLCSLSAKPYSKIALFPMLGNPQSTELMIYHSVLGRLAGKIVFLRPLSGKILNPRADLRQPFQHQLQLGV